ANYFWDGKFCGCMVLLVFFHTNDEPIIQELLAGCVIVKRKDSITARSLIIILNSYPLPYKISEWSFFTMSHTY
ncbi:MAG: hypothetical protein IKF58_06830, partial [Bacillus sp. (in: Bacteria)]|nr:hypothetical protein [Bacillus sp. (in: firmicutes)]